MAKSGRPKVPPAVHACVWTLVEARRDGDAPGKRRLSVSRAAERLSKELRETDRVDFSSRRLREIHAETERMLRAGESPDPRDADGTMFAEVCRLNLEAIRAHRNRVGWDQRFRWHKLLDVAAPDGTPE